MNCNSENSLPSTIQLDFFFSVFADWIILLVKLDWNFFFIYLFFFFKLIIFIKKSVVYIAFGHVKVKLATLVKSDLKVPFSIATTPGCRGGHYSFPRVAPLYPWSIPYKAVKQGNIKYHFLCLWYDSTWDWTPVSWIIGKHSTLDLIF